MRLRANRRNWDERTPVHARSDFYDVEGFRRGRITLTGLERREVGEVSGKRLLHLQCHFGLDTMSWSRLGARATGVDFSGTAIDLARSLNEEAGLGARFIRSDVYRLPEALGERFDIVFTSYGVLSWLPDIAAWAEVVRAHLAPGGLFYIVDFHPVAAIFEAAGEGDLVPAYSYFPHEIFVEGGEPGYAGTEPIESPHYEWQHGLGEVVSALLDAGLGIEFLHEFPFTRYRAHAGMERGPDGWWRLPGQQESLPLMFSIRASG